VNWSVSETAVCQTAHLHLPVTFCRSPSLFLSFLIDNHTYPLGNLEQDLRDIANLSFYHFISLKDLRDIANLSFYHFI